LSPSHRSPRPDSSHAEAAAAARPVLVVAHSQATPAAAAALSSLPCPALALGPRQGARRPPQLASAPDPWSRGGLHRAWVPNHRAQGLAGPSATRLTHQERFICASSGQIASVVFLLMTGAAEGVVAVAELEAAREAEVEVEVEAVAGGVLHGVGDPLVHRGVVAGTVPFHGDAEGA